jgi:poly(3-hydroxybutyrate) depolymerase
MCMRISSLIGISTALLLCARALAQKPVLSTASNHPVQYYLSLPHGWSADRTWPVVIVLDGGNKNFLEMARTFDEARGSLPFILVTPVILTNGGADLRPLPEYHYPTAVWDEVDRSGKCKFDFEGLEAIIGDVQAKYRGDAKVFITGHSAGAHLAWGMVFQHPEKLAAAAVTCGNYKGRCMTEEGFSTAQDRAELPVKGFQGALDRARTPLEGQFQGGRSVAEQHGYRNISFEVVADARHDPFARRVLEYFDSLRESR